MATNGVPKGETFWGAVWSATEDQLFYLATAPVVGGLSGMLPAGRMLEGTLTAASTAGKYELKLALSDKWLAHLGAQTLENAVTNVGLAWGDDKVVHGKGMTALDLLMAGINTAPGTVHLLAEHPGGLLHRAIQISQLRNAAPAVMDANLRAHPLFAPYLDGEPSATDHLVVVSGTAGLKKAAEDLAGAAPEKPAVEPEVTPETNPLESEVTSGAEPAVPTADVTRTDPVTRSEPAALTDDAPATEQTAQPEGAPAINVAAAFGATDPAEADAVSVEQVLALDYSSIDGIVTSDSDGNANGIVMRKRAARDPRAVAAKLLEFYAANEFKTTARNITKAGQTLDRATFDFLARLLTGSSEPLSVAEGVIENIFAGMGVDGRAFLAAVLGGDTDQLRLFAQQAESIEVAPPARTAAPDPARTQAEETAAVESGGPQPSSGAGSLPASLLRIISRDPQLMAPIQDPAASEPQTLSDFEDLMPLSPSGASVQDRIGLRDLYDALNGQRPPENAASPVPKSLIEAILAHPELLDPQSPRYLSPDGLSELLSASSEMPELSSEDIAGLSDLTAALTGNYLQGPPWSDVAIQGLRDDPELRGFLVALPRSQEEVQAQRPDMDSTLASELSNFSGVIDRVRQRLAEPLAAGPWTIEQIAAAGTALRPEMGPMTERLITAVRNGLSVFDSGITRDEFPAYFPMADLSDGERAHLFALYGSTRTFSLRAYFAANPEQQSLSEPGDDVTLDESAGNIQPPAGQDPDATGGPGPNGIQPSVVKSSLGDTLRDFIATSAAPVETPASLSEASGTDSAEPVSAVSAAAGVSRGKGPGILRRILATLLSRVVPYQDTTPVDLAATDAAVRNVVGVPEGTASAAGAMRFVEGDELESLGRAALAAGSDGAALAPAAVDFTKMAGFTARDPNGSNDPTRRIIAIRNGFRNNPHLAAHESAHFYVNDDWAAFAQRIRLTSVIGLGRGSRPFDTLDELAADYIAAKATGGRLPSSPDANRLAALIDAMGEDAFFAAYRDGANAPDGTFDTFKQLAEQSFGARAAASPASEWQPNPVQPAMGGNQPQGGTDTLDPAALAARQNELYQNRVANVESAIAAVIEANNAPLQPGETRDVKTYVFLGGDTEQATLAHSGLYWWVKALAPSTPTELAGKTKYVVNAGARSLLQGQAKYFQKNQMELHLPGSNTPVRLYFNEDELAQLRDDTLPLDAEPLQNLMSFLAHFWTSATFEIPGEVEPVTGTKIRLPDAPDVGMFTEPAQNKDGQWVAPKARQGGHSHDREGRLPSKGYRYPAGITSDKPSRMDPSLISGLLTWHTKDDEHGLRYQLEGWMPTRRILPGIRGRHGADYVTHANSHTIGTRPAGRKPTLIGTLFRDATVRSGATRESWNVSTYGANNYTDANPIKLKPSIEVQAGLLINQMANEMTGEEAVNAALEEVAHPLARLETSIKQIISENARLMLGDGVKNGVLFRIATEKTENLAHDQLRKLPYSGDWALGALRSRMRGERPRGNIPEAIVERNRHSITADASAKQVDAVARSTVGGTAVAAAADQAARTDAALVVRDHMGEAAPAVSTVVIEAALKAAADAFGTEDVIGGGVTAAAEAAAANAAADEHVQEAVADAAATGGAEAAAKITSAAGEAAKSAFNAIVRARSEAETAVKEDIREGVFKATEGTLDALTKRGLTIKAKWETRRVRPIAQKAVGQATPELAEELMKATKLRENGEVPVPGEKSLIEAAKARAEVLLEADGSDDSVVEDIYRRNEHGSVSQSYAEAVRTVLERRMAQIKADAGGRPLTASDLEALHRNPTGPSGRPVLETEVRHELEKMLAQLNGSFPTAAARPDAQTAPPDAQAAQPAAQSPATPDAAARAAFGEKLDRYRGQAFTDIRDELKG
ncbi:MAG: hypothetical protein WCB02_28930, partial [Bradyrhizobium sp.]